MVSKHGQLVFIHTRFSIILMAWWKHNRILMSVANKWRVLYCIPSLFCPNNSILVFVDPQPLFIIYGLLVLFVTYAQKRLFLLYSPIEHRLVQIVLNSWTMHSDIVCSDIMLQVFGAGLWVKLFSPSFASVYLRFFLACHSGHLLELCLLSSISSLSFSEWKLTAEMSQLFGSLPCTMMLNNLCLLVILHFFLKQIDIDSLHRRCKEKTTCIWPPNILCSNN